MGHGRQRLNKGLISSVHFSFQRALNEACVSKRVLSALGGWGGTQAGLCSCSRELTDFGLSQRTTPAPDRRREETDAEEQTPPTRLEKNDCPSRLPAGLS